MNKSAYLYISLTAIASIVVIAVQPWPSLAELSHKEVMALSVLVGLVVLSEWMAIDITIGSNRRVRSSMAFLPWLTCAILFSHAATILVTAISAVISQITLRKRTLWRVVGTPALAVLSIAGGKYVYELLRRSDAQNRDVDLLAFFGLALTFFLLDTLIVSGLYTLRARSSFGVVFRQVIGPGAINVVYGLLASPIAVFAAYLYAQLYIGGLILITLPLLLVRYSYVSKIQVEQSNRDLLKVLIKTIETRDPYTSGHSLRVSWLARLIAEDLGLSLKQVEMVETAALLHDIGKIDSVYAEIIQKRSALTEEEHHVIKTHAVKGAELLQNLTSFDDDVIRGVRHHHERFDGKGYPEGLTGTDIPIAARIIMLCDAIDAMLSDRPYRSAMTVEQVRNEISRCAGTQFDPEIVGVVLSRNTLERAAAQICEEAPATFEVAGARGA